MDDRSQGEGGKWHFCCNCSEWPDEGFDAIVLPNLPRELELCPECVALHERGECKEM